MTNVPGSPSRRRPVFIANYRGSTDDPALLPDTSILANRESEPGDTPPEASRLRLLRSGLRYNFPPLGPATEGGHSDGYCYRIPFAAGRADRTYELILAFLREQGYANIPLPADIDELRRFRLPPKLRHQLSLFGEDGYVHNPVKILFPTPTCRRGGLILELYNENTPGHLLKFHRR